MIREKERSAVSGLAAMAILIPLLLLIVYEFITSASEFVPVTNLEKLPQTFIGIKAHAIAIGNSDQYQVEKLFQAG